MTTADLIEMNWFIHAEVFGHASTWSTEVPSYMTDLEDAWLVLDKLVELGFDFCLSPAGKRTKGYELEIIVTEKLYTEHGYVGCYDTDRDLPLLICRAALHGLGLNKPDA